MKTFYEMMMILDKAKGLQEWGGASFDYGAGEMGDWPSFSKVLGEDDEDPFTLEVYVSEGNWEVEGSIYVKRYVLNGSESPASQPVAYETGDNPGVEFKNPGKKLELLPASIKANAIAWVNEEVIRAIENYDPYEGAPD